MRALSLGLAALLATPTVATADENVPPLPGFPDDNAEAKPKLRGGFAVGAGLGVSRFNASGDASELAGGGGSLLIRVGTTATDDLLWSLQFEASSRKGTLGEDEFTLGHAVLSLGAQYYFRPKLYVRGGLGLASLQRVFEASDIADDKEGSLVLCAGGGYDLYRRGRFVVDVQLNLSAGKFGEDPLTVSALQFGANWY